ncbi:MAG: gliding motility-associated ABC transporter ATP-binding subunit GldA [Cyclobacteriaceae bacterium]
MSVEVVALTKIYGEQRAVDQISFEAPGGLITGFLGPNGAGKSTTMKIATGYLKPTKGDVLVDGLSVVDKPLDVKRITGYLPEHNPMYMDMYVSEFLEFIGQAYGMGRAKRRKRVQELFELCGLQIEKGKRLKALSKGYRQRVGLAKALLPDPKVLVLDEPTSGLDPNQILEIRNVIKEISKDKTVILSTHIMQEVEALCDKVIIINQGSLVADDSLSDLKAKVSDQTIMEVAFEEPVDQALFSRLTGVTNVEKVNATTYRVASKAESLRSQIMELTNNENLKLSAMKSIGNDLEQIFHELTKGGIDD